jgi:uncharacterized lipoprotein
MVKKTVLVLCVLLSCVACGSEIKRLKETEYLRTQPGKPVVYPEDIDSPAQEKIYVVPELPGSERAASETPELLVLPPRLVGVDLAEDEEDEAGDESGDGAEEGKSVDDGFLERAR